MRDGARHPHPAVGDELSPTRRARAAHSAPAVRGDLDGGGYRAVADLPEPLGPPAAAVIGGVGFGFFIDELGKFITADNNYFFKPAPALIYLILVGIFLGIRALERRRGLSEVELLSNALDLTGEAARRDFDEREKRRALALISQADPNDPVVAPVRRLLVQLDALPVASPVRPARLAKRIHDAYLRLAETRMASSCGRRFPG